MRLVSCEYACIASTEIGCGPFGPTWRRSFKKQYAPHTQNKSGNRIGTSSFTAFCAGGVLETAVIFLLPFAANAALNFSLLASLLDVGD